jgi:hypothetical protein
VLANTPLNTSLTPEVRWAGGKEEGGTLTEARFMARLRNSRLRLGKLIEADGMEPSPDDVLIRTAARMKLFSEP